MSLPRSSADHGATTPQRGLPCDRTLIALLREADRPPVWDDVVDWTPLLAEAQEQGVAPLLYHRLGLSRTLDRLPGDAQQTLRQAHRQTWVKNLFYLQTLEQVLAILAAAGIRPLLLKGASLTQTVYPHPALRPMNDIDLLVAPEQFRAALTALRAAGARPTHGEPFDGAYELVTHHVGLSLPGEIDVLLELHHQWLSLPQDQAGLATWQELDARARPVDAGPVHARVLGVEDQVLHLCAHMALHGPANWRLIWTYDVDQVIRQAGADLGWDTLLANAVRYQMVQPLQAVLPAIAAGLGTPLPADVLQRLVSLPVTSGERQRYAASALGPHTRLSDGWQKLAGLEGAGARVRFAWGLALPAWSYMRQVHPGDSPLRLAARYPARWAGVLGEFGRALRPRGRS